MSEFYQALVDAFHSPGTQVYRRTSAFVWALILLSIVLYGLELWMGHKAFEERGLTLVDKVILTAFAVELVLRVITFRPSAVDFYNHGHAGAIRAHLLGRLTFLFRPLIFVDLLTVIAVYPPLRGLRAMRLLRLLRTARVFKYSSPFRGIARAFEENRLLYAFGFTIFGILVVLGGLSIYQAEVDANEDIATIGDGLWWAMVTLTTVGFGDITPVTPLGRIIGSALMVCGMVSLAMFAGIVGNTLLHYVLTMREEHLRLSQYVDHVIICGYTAGARGLLVALNEELDLDQRTVVIFAEGDRPTDVHPDFVWINGDATKESELDKVRMAFASTAIVVGSRKLRTQEADAQTILTAFTIRRYLQHHQVTPKRARPLYLVSEILDTENVDHARTAGVDEVIETTRFGFTLVAHAIDYPGTAALMGGLAESRGHSLFVGHFPEDIELPSSFGPVADRLRDTERVLAVGLRDEKGRTTLNPTGSTVVTPTMQVVYMATKPVLTG